MSASTDTPAWILAAADALFGEVGYSGASARDVAARAGVTKASVFYHFGSMEALFERVMSQYYDAHRAALQGAFDRPGTPRERLHRLIDAYLDFIADNQRYPRLAQGQAATGDPTGVVERNLTPLFDWTVDALASITPTSGPLAARQFFVTISGAVIHYFTYGPVLAAHWGQDPLSPAAVDERREHVHWLVDTCLDRLHADVKTAPPPSR